MRDQIEAFVPPHSIEAEQSVLGALLMQNDAIERINVRGEHFYREDHRIIFTEIVRQISAGKTSDVITVFDALSLAGKADDVGGLPYLNALAQNTPSSANIRRYAEMVRDRARSRQLAMVASEMHDLAMSSPEDVASLIDQFATKLEALAQRTVRKEPQRFSEMLVGYVELIQARMEGRIKPIKTGFPDLDNQLDGGLERGTVTVVAARPGKGKTALALAICRNVAEWGAALFLSLEMSAAQVSDRNIAALGKLPLKWLRRPADKTPEDRACWDAMTHAFAQSERLNLHICDETGLNMLAIRAKARSVKRKHGLDVLVIDQLSFITGGKSDKSYEVVGEYTRALIALAKEIDCAVILLCQLNRECERRPDKRPILADLAVSGSIEQDAANVIFLYRDEVYNQDTRDKGVCEVIIPKQRQGEPGHVALAYIGAQTRFESLQHPWHPAAPSTRPAPRSRGLD